MFAGVATGVRNDADAATHTLIRTGRAEMSSWLAADTATGIITSAVAVLLISWPNATVTMNSAISSTVGPASPTASTRMSAICCAAPESVMAVESGINPATSSTVVHEMPR